MVVPRAWLALRVHCRRIRLGGKKEELAAFTVVLRVFRDWVCVRMVGGNILLDV